MPTFAELDEDQRGIYTKAPADRAVLVTGPPGTGKTVVAFHRALRLSEGGDHVTLAMFNKVLSKYANSADLEEKHDVSISNVHKWVDQWYRRAFGRSYPYKRNRGEINWPRIGKNIREISNTSKLNKLCWGHLIIDEGQDFPVSMYEALMTLIDHPLLPDSDRPTLTVFADENQTITDQNSTVKEIRQTLDAGFRNKRYWRLYKNYRNTRQVAEFATFYQLTGRGAAKLPDRTGIKPQIIMQPSHSEVAEHVTNFIINNGNLEVGVLSFGQKGDVRNIHSELVGARERKKSKHKIQMYVSGHPNESIHHNAEGLSFGSAPSITVLHYRSAKGLEFDAVFVVNLHTDGRAFDAYARELIKDMYVVSSRARSTLFFDLVCFNACLPQTTRLLPSPDRELCRYSANTEWKDELSEKLSEVSWTETEEMAEQLRAHSLAEEILALGETGEDVVKEIVNESKTLHSLRDKVDKYLDNLDKDNVALLIKEIGCNRVDSKLKDLV